MFVSWLNPYSEDILALVSSLYGLCRHYMVYVLAIGISAGKFPFEILVRKFGAILGEYSEDKNVLTIGLNKFETQPFKLKRSRFSNR